MNCVHFKRSIQIDELIDFISSLNLDVNFYILDGSKVIGISDGREPASNTICFLENSSLANKKDVIYFLKERIEGISCIVIDDPKFLFIKFLEYIKKLENFNYLPKDIVAGISNKSYIHPSAVIEKNVYIEENVIVSAGVIIKSGSVIKRDTIIRENVVIGCHGIALYKSKLGEVMRFPHLSGVYIGSNVEVGANSVIVQGTLSPTIVENDVVIGNLCNIGHNSIIRSKVWMSVGSMIGGNCIIEESATIGMGTTVKDNLLVSENTSIGMGSNVIKSTEYNKSYFGNPAKEIRGIKTGPVR